LAKEPRTTARIVSVDKKANRRPAQANAMKKSKISLDTDFVRSQFPAFQAEESRDWIFFENAGGAYVPATVIERLKRFFRSQTAQTPIILPVVMSVQPVVEIQ